MSVIKELGDISLPFALDEKKNYIYIKDAYRDRDYYCPCCGKKVNTIAIDEDKEYLMPPHYRHYPHQSCSGESLAHWVYKMWLFDKDSQFYVYNGSGKTLYTVKTIDIEKTFVTDYGDYRPDITITTTCDKVFFFELNFTNPKRGDDYFCKWSQLNNDVIEVDVKKLLKESLNDKIPTFRLVYSDGMCFDDKYNRRDAFAGASNILTLRKLEIKRQDILNCKTIWEKLDWFFDSLKLYKAMKSTMDDVLKSFSEVPYKEMELCFDIVKKITCINNNDAFRNIINANFDKNIDELLLKYNNLYRNQVIFTIKRNYCYKTVWNIECKTIDSVGIINVSKHMSTSQLTWRKHYFPYSFYIECENIILKYNNILIKHFLIVNEINCNISKLLSTEDYEYIKTQNICYNFTQNLLDNDEYIEQYEVKILSYIREKIYRSNKQKVDDAVNNYNLNNKEIKCEYVINKNEEIQITSITFTFYSIKYNNILCKKIKLCSQTIENNDIDDFINSTTNDKYKKIKRFKINIDNENMINMEFANIISNIKQIMHSRCNYLYLDYNCPDIYTVKFRVGIRINHGSHWHKNYEYYHGKYIELKNNLINELCISGMDSDNLYEFIIGKLVESKKTAIEKFNKIDGLYSDSRSIFVTEDKTNA